MIGRRWEESTRVLSADMVIEYECLGIGWMTVDVGEETYGRQELVGFYLSVHCNEIAGIRGKNAPHEYMNRMM